VSLKSPKIKGLVRWPWLRGNQEALEAEFIHYVKTQSPDFNKFQTLNDSASSKPEVGADFVNLAYNLVFCFVKKVTSKDPLEMEEFPGAVEAHRPGEYLFQLNDAELRMFAGKFVGMLALHCSSLLMFDTCCHMCTCRHCSEHLQFKKKNNEDKKFKSSRHNEFSAKNTTKIS